MIPILMPLIAVFLPVAALARLRKKPLRQPWACSLLSFAACCAAMCQEVYVLGRRAEHGDVSGILDTWRAVLLICIALAAVTLLVNLLLLAAGYAQAGEKHDE